MSHLVSIIMPCRNEGPFIENAVRDALAQERKGFDLELIVAVGPSTDDTYAIVNRLASENAEVRMIENPAGVVPHGLNAAIRASKGEFIVRMDAHSRYPKDYCAVLTQALVRLNADNVGGIWNTLPANQSDKAWAIAAVLSSGLGVGNATFRLGTKEERDVDTVPYGCFRRELFDRIGFFDEELVRNQDDEHNGRIINAGGRIVLLPQVVIDYFPRDRIRKLWRMYREYGLFKPLVNIKLGAPATMRQFAPPLFVLALFGLPFLSIFFQVFGWPWLAMVALYELVVLATSLRLVAKANRWSAFLWTVIAFVTVHIAYGVGYLQGIVRFMIFRHKVDHTRVSTNR